MRIRILLRSIAVLAACSPTKAADVNPPGPLSGVWAALGQPLQGENLVLSLEQRGDSIAGTGTYKHEVIQPPSGTLKLAGFYSQPNLVLAIKYDYGQVSVLSGALTDSIHIAGSEAPSGFASYSVTFTKQ
jgi:hypothetical protein